MHSVQLEWKNYQASKFKFPDKIVRLFLKYFLKQKTSVTELKLGLSSQFRNVQILTNNVQMLILCLSYFITTVKFFFFLTRLQEYDELSQSRCCHWKNTKQFLSIFFRKNKNLNNKVNSKQSSLKNKNLNLIQFSELNSSDRMSTSDGTSIRTAATRDRHSPILRSPRMPVIRNIPVQQQQQLQNYGQTPSMVDDRYGAHFTIKNTGC